MKKDSVRSENQSSTVVYEHFESFARQKVQAFLQDILEQEVMEFLGRAKGQRKPAVDGLGGYRNGHGKTRKFTTMSGTISIRRPRIRGTEEHFESKVLPLFAKRTKEVGQMLPELYLHGLSMGDFELAMRGLLGEGAPLSASSIERLKAKWQFEYEQWKQRDLSDLEVVYHWADGIYVKAGLEKDKAALLVIIAALTDGRKVMLACESGYRESKESWSALLRDLKNRGLRLGKLTIADGHLGIWSALTEVHPEGREQRCWNHKITNVLDTFPKKLRFAAAQQLKAMPYAETKKACEKLRNAFVAKYEQNYPKAVQTLLRDWERMVTFYSFPKEHWVHIRTTNIVESPFSSVRLRTDAAKRFKKVQNATAMIWKLLLVAEKRFRRLKGYELLKDVYQGKEFADGVAVQMPSVIAAERKAA
jgi:putative transposase